MEKNNTVAKSPKGEGKRGKGCKGWITIAEEINHLLWPRQTAQIALDHHPVETVIYKNQQTAKQLCERLHRSAPSICLSNKIIGQPSPGIKISNIFG